MYLVEIFKVGTSENILLKLNKEDLFGFIQENYHKKDFKYVIYELKCVLDLS